LLQDQALLKLVGYLSAPSFTCKNGLQWFEGKNSTPVDAPHNEFDKEQVQNVEGLYAMFGITPTNTNGKEIEMI
jgi:hypothetical protein